jgi:hypothetical protein
MRGAGHTDVHVVLQVPGNKADAVPCERLRFFWLSISPVNAIAFDIWAVIIEERTPNQFPCFQGIAPIVLLLPGYRRGSQ